MERLTTWIDRSRRETRWIRSRCSHQSSKASGIVLSGELYRCRTCRVPLGWILRPRGNYILEWNAGSQLGGARNVKSERIEVAKREERKDYGQRAEAPNIPRRSWIKFFERMLRVVLSYFGVFLKKKWASIVVIGNVILPKEKETNIFILYVMWQLSLHIKGTRKKVIFFTKWHIIYFRIFTHNIYTAYVQIKFNVLCEKNPTTKCLFFRSKYIFFVLYVLAIFCYIYTKKQTTNTTIWCVWKPEAWKIYRHSTFTQ